MNRLMVKHEGCTGCRICQLVCSSRVVKEGYNLKEAAIHMYTNNFVDIPIVCRQCKKAPCQDSCPVGAFSRQATGALTIDETVCIGCGKCVEVCPFNAIYMHPSHVSPIKCDLCGGEPHCVKYCPNGVLFLQDETALGAISGENMRELAGGI